MRGLRVGLWARSSAGSTAPARRLFDIAVVVALVYSLDSEKARAIKNQPVEVTAVPGG